ncbi:mechanosensitive ion channel [Fuchsiella alkaliacetigena]|nr:mechanosensitive ion channel [Fuchsiella alkaliacetigena]
MFFLLAWLLNKKSKSLVKNNLSKIPGLKMYRARKLAEEVLMPFLWWLFTWSYFLLGTPLGLPTILTAIAGNLLNAWLLIRVISILLPGESLMVKGLSYFVWTVAFLNIIGLYSPVVEMLDNIVLTGGNINLSLLDIISGLLIFILLFWLSGQLHSVLKKQIQFKTTFTPSVKLLLYKTTRVLLITLAVLITLSSLGVELSTFAFLGGAIGVGIGFGLQKIVSNYVSGIIILLDRSVKPGDVIEIDDVFGRIRAQETRFVSMITLAGKEYLIPNEKFITEQVINWSYSDRKVRLNVLIGVGYGSDLRLVEELILEAMSSIDRVLTKPEPECLLKEFGDNTVDFELRFWINNPGQGIDNVRSEVLFAVWDNFAREGIEIAFPQRDLNLKSISSELLAQFTDFCNSQNNSAPADLNVDPTVDKESQSPSHQNDT